MPRATPSHSLRSPASRASPYGRTSRQTSHTISPSRTVVQDLYPLPLPSCRTPRPLHATEQALVDTLGRLQFFLATAPTQWSEQASTAPPGMVKFPLPNGESISCVLWNGLFHITGTDIVRALAFRFEAFARPVKACKKWEEGVFSDLRNLKPGVDATLEEPKSPLLDYLFQNGCIRTQKKQKVFYWFSVQHDRLFLDALERDMKREKAGQEPTTIVCGEPAQSFRYDPRQTLYEQFAGRNQGLRSISPPPSMLSEHHARPPTSNSGAGGYILNSSVSNDLRAREASLSVEDWPSSGQYHEPLSQDATDPRGYSTMQTVQGCSLSPLAYAARSTSWGIPQLEDEMADLSATTDVALRGSVSSQGYTCPHRSCKRRFKRLEHLRRHEKTHTNDRPFHCWICPKTFSRHDNLLQHTKIHCRLPNQMGPKGAKVKNPPVDISTKLSSLPPDIPLMSNNDGEKANPVENLTVWPPCDWNSDISKQALRPWTAPPDCEQIVMRPSPSPQGTLLPLYDPSYILPTNVSSRSRTTNGVSSLSPFFL